MDFCHCLLKRIRADRVEDLQDAEKMLERVVNRSSCAKG
jgi:hypothetical protein